MHGIALLCPLSLILVGVFGVCRMLIAIRSGKLSLRNTSEDRTITRWISGEDPGPESTLERQQSPGCWWVCVVFYFALSACVLSAGVMMLMGTLRSS
jgi:hypothetical protein